MTGHESLRKSLPRMFNKKVNDDFNPFEVPSENEVYNGGNLSNLSTKKPKTSKRRSSISNTNIKRSQHNHKSLKSVNTACSSNLSSTISPRKTVTFIRPFAQIIEVESYKQYNKNISQKSNQFKIEHRRNKKDKIVCSCNTF